MYEWMNSATSCLSLWSLALLEIPWNAWESASNSVDGYFEAENNGGGTWIYNFSSVRLVMR